jgi:hypothetical protein
VGCHGSKTYLTLKVSPVPSSILVIVSSDSEASSLVFLLAWSFTLISPNLCFQKFHRSIENPSAPFQFHPPTFEPGYFSSCGVRQCEKMTSPASRIYIAAKGMYISSWGPCVRYALDRLSGSTSKASLKSPIEKYWDWSMRPVFVRCAVNATMFCWCLRMASLSEVSYGLMTMKHDDQTHWIIYQNMNQKYYSNVYSPSMSFLSKEDSTKSSSHPNQCLIESLFKLVRVNPLALQ